MRGHLVRRSSVLSRRGSGVILYVNACVRKESRTDRLARHLLQKLGGKYVEVRLSELDLEPLSEECLKVR